MKDSPQELIGFLLERAAKHKGLEADCLFAHGVSSSATVRLGEIEDLTSSESAELGLRLVLGHRQACVSISDFRESSLETLFDRALAMAEAAPEDTYVGLAGSDRLFKGADPDLDILDQTDLTADQLIELAGQADAAALAVENVKNSGGASMSYGRSTRYMATSQGFFESYTGSTYSLSATAVAGQHSSMERDYDYCSTRHFSDLETPFQIGTTAGERAVARLNPKKTATRKMPVVYAPRVANGLLGHLGAAINGRAITRATSFLNDRMGDRLFRDDVQIIDDPRRLRGLGSKPFDGEGVATSPLNIIESGRLRSWILDCATARQLGLQSTGHASRGMTSPPFPSTTNLYLEAGEANPDELISDISEGLYVCEFIGMGVNTVTGDYSRGAAGFLIENGEIGHPVTELTVAGNLGDMFAQLIPASDLEFRYGIDSPTVRIDSMIVAGS
jgi:PmbA protein